MNKNNDFVVKSYIIPKTIVEKYKEIANLNSLCIEWTGLYVNAFGHAVKLRTLSNYTMVYCTDGKGYLHINGKEYSIVKGDIFICPVDVSHSYEADLIEPWTKYWVHFNGESVQKFMKLLGLSLENPVMQIGYDSTIISYFHNIFTELSMGYTKNRVLMSSAYLNMILCQINKVNVPFRDSDSNQKVISYMQNNICSNPTLDELAEISNFSKYYFTRQFKEATGYTPIDYFVRLKIQKACELLENSRMSISQISSELRFSTPYYFSITFKRITGMSPSNYRKRFGSHRVHEW